MPRAWIAHLRIQEDSGEKLGVLLVTLGVVAQRDVSEALADQLGLPLVEAASYPELPILEERVSARFLRESRALPLAEDESELALAMADPTDEYTVNAFEMVTGRKVRPQVAIPMELEAALERLYGAGKSALGQILGDVEQRDDLAFDADVQQLKDLASEAPVIRLVSLIITNALDTRASDIHIEPFENRLIVRYRIDGVLHEVESPPRRLSAAVISRIKIMANLDIAERRLPQDGRIRLRVQGKEIDLRVSTVPTMHGEIGGHAYPRQGRRRARLQAARLRRRYAEEIPRRAAGTARHPARHRPDRQRQDDDAVHGARPPEPARRQDPHRRGPGRIPDGRASTRSRSSRRSI